MNPVNGTPKKSHADAVREHEQNVEKSNARKNRNSAGTKDSYASGSEAKPSTAVAASPTILPDEPAAAPSHVQTTTANGVSVPVVATTRTVEVTNAQELKAALSAAKTGDNIKLARGSYPGPITLSGKSGVTLSGPSDAVITTPESTKKPSMAVTDCDSCSITGISITGGQKGLMVQNTQNSVFDNVQVSNTAMEGVHFKNNSSGNTLQNSEVHHTGLGGDTQAGNGRTQAMDGEGVYIGTAKSNNPSGDTSNNNSIVNNRIHDTTAENIDIKEFTKGGRIIGNTLDGAACGEGATANIEVKGSGYTVTGNTITNTHKTGIKNYAVKGVDGSGTNNTIANNTMA